MKIHGHWLLAALLLAAPNLSADDPVVRHSVEGDFADVRTNVEVALSGHGLVVSGVSLIGEMLERTGRDIGATRKIYEHAEVVEFCSAVLSRTMLEADPHTIAYCPYQIAIYVLPEEPETVYLSYRRPGPGKTEESSAALAEVEALLEAVVQDSMW